MSEENKKEITIILDEFEKRLEELENKLEDVKNERR